MPVIDAHVHLYPPELGPDPAAWAAGRGEKHWATLCARRRRDGLAVQHFPSVAELLREMDRAGVQKSVLLGWYWERPETCAEQNRFYADCVRAHPDRLAAFAAIHPAGPPDEVRRARDGGFLGLGELSPHSQRIDRGDPRWREILRLAGELGLPVNLHVTDPEARKHPGWVDTPRADFLQLAQDFPGTTFILAHWGGGLAFDSSRGALPNVWFDSAASPLMYGPDVWTRAVSAVGTGRLLFGSDNPLRLYPRTEAGVGLGALVREATANLPPTASGAVLGENARRLLRL